jgi:hypothetical protein
MPSWAAMNAWTAMATTTSVTGSRTRPKLKPIASSSRLMLRPSPTMARPRASTSRSAASSSFSSSESSIQAPSVISATAAT